MQIPFPSKGLSDLDASARQMPLTTTVGVNVQTVDAQTGRLVGAQRSGMMAYTGAEVIAGTKVRFIAEFVHDNPTNTYTILGNSLTLEGSTKTPSATDCPAMCGDVQGNVYVVDGNTAITKYNSEWVKQWTIALPTTEPGALVRWVQVDDEYRVFTGVSAGGSVDKAKLWCYEQLDENKTALLWELLPGYFTEWAELDGVRLVAAQNNPTLWQSRVIQYTGINVPTPTEIAVMEVPYPINQLDVSGKDQSIWTAHPPRTNRGFFPRSPETTGRTEDWTIRDLPNVERRLRSWCSSRDVDGDDTFNANVEDGAVVDTWVDKSGNGRNWYARTGDFGPVLRKNVFAGRDTLFFNGTNTSMVGEAPVSTEFQYQQLNGSILPSHAKGQFAAFFLFRTAVSSTRSVLFSQSYTTAANNRDNLVMVNCAFNGTALTDAPGCVFLTEQPEGGSGVSGRGVTASTRQVPLGGCFDSDGLVLVTYIFDHGYDDVTGAGTRSMLRVNGRPCDRWTSRTGYESLCRAALGIQVFSNDTTAGTRFKGDLLEVVVLQDWYETASGPTTAYSQQSLVETPEYPDVVWSSGSETELEKIEGWLMHGAGSSHKLPSGHQGILESNNNTLNVANNDTVTIAGEVYTYKTALTPTAGEVLIGASDFDSLRNLHNAINKTGLPGTQYASDTDVHPTVWSPGVLENTGSVGALRALLVQARDANASSYTTTEASVRLSWLQGATSGRTRNGSGTAAGFYPHPYFLYRTADSTGGPPPSTGTGQSEAAALTSPYGLLAKWDPASGRIKDSITTAGPGNSGLGYGGVGYGVRCLDDGTVYSIGPRQAIVTNLGVSADAIDHRKFFDTGTAITVTNAATDAGAWVADPGEHTYAYPRMDVDETGNLYVPVHQGSSGTSLLVYRKSSVGSGTGSNAALLYSLTSLTGDPKGLCCLADPKYPSWPTSFDRSTAALTPRAERVYLGTIKDSSDVSLFLLREVSVAANSNGPRTNVRLAVAGSSLYTIAAGGSPALVSASAVDSGSRYVDGVSLGGRFFLVDGSKYYVHDPLRGVSGGWRAQKGKIPLRAKLIERFSSRIFLAAFGDNRHGWACSEYDEPYGWDFDPPGDAPRITAAVNSDLSDLGEFPDVINSMCAYRNDVIILGGDHTIAAMTGDPAQGGRFDTIVRGFGVAFGRARCFTPDGRFWFLTTQGELYSMPIGGAPEQVGRHVQRRLSASLDMSSANVELHYDPIERQIRILQMVRGSPSTLYTHWRYELETGALWQDTFGSTNVQPTAACLADGDQPNDRVFLVGGGDGWVRYFSRTAQEDDGVRIDSQVRCHLPVDNEEPGAVLFSDLVVRLSSGQYGAQYDFYVTDDPEDWGGSVVTGNLAAGENVLPQVRYSGQFCAIDIKAATSTQRWALERITLDARKVSDR